MKNLKVLSIDYYYDFVNIPAWIMFERLINVQNQNNCVSINFYPIHAETLIKAAENKTPYSVASLKKNYFEEQRLFSRLHGISISTQHGIIDNLLSENSDSHLPQLVSNLLGSEFGQSKLFEFSRALWRRLWIKNKSTHNDENIKEVLAKINIDQERVSTLMTDEKWSALLNSNHNRAINSKCFGIPWTVLHFEDGSTKNVFGSDRWPLVCYYLNIPCKSFGDIKLS